MFREMLRIKQQLTPEECIMTGDSARKEAGR